MSPEAHSVDDEAIPICRFRDVPELQQAACCNDLHREERVAEDLIEILRRHPVAHPAAVDGKDQIQECDELQLLLLHDVGSEADDDGSKPHIRDYRP